MSPAGRDALPRLGGGRKPKSSRGMVIKVWQEVKPLGTKKECVRRISRIDRSHSATTRLRRSTVRCSILPVTTLRTPQQLQQILSSRKRQLGKVDLTLLQHANPSDSVPRTDRPGLAAWPEESPPNLLPFRGSDGPAGRHRGCPTLAVASAFPQARSAPHWLMLGRRFHRVQRSRGLSPDFSVGIFRGQFLQQLNRGRSAELAQQRDGSPDDDR
jgi:hypothetical protein